MSKVSPSREGLYLLLFFAQSAVGLGLVCWREVVFETEDNLLETILAIGQAMGPLVIVVAAWTVTAVEGTAMLAERYLKRRHEEGRREERQELLTRLGNLPPEERSAEIDRLIAENRLFLNIESKSPPR